MKENLINANDLLKDIQTLIEQSKQKIAVSVNSTMSLLYWDIGNYISKNILQSKKPAYGKRIIENLSIQLTE